jgi:hypothetical protein
MPKINGELSPESILSLNQSEAFSLKERGSNGAFTLSTISLCLDGLPKLKNFPATIRHLSNPATVERGAELRIYRERSQRAAEFTGDNFSIGVN